MTSVVAQTCSVPVRKMELLSVELRLLKDAIQLMSGRVELLLDEIAALQLERAATEEREHEIQLNLTGDDKAELLFAEAPHSTMPSRIAPAVHASGQEMRAADLAADEPLAPISVDAPPIAISINDGTEPGDEAVPPAAAEPTEQTPAVDTPLDETPQPAAQTCDEIAIKEVATEPEPAAVAASSPASELPHNIVVLDECRGAPTLNVRRPLRSTTRWAAAVALLAISLVVAADSTGFAAGLRELLISDASCAEGPQVCGPFGGLPY